MNFDVDNENKIFRVGFEGLLFAAVKYEMNSEEDFNKYAVKYILQDIKKELEKSEK